MAPLFKPSLVFLSTENLSEVQTEINVRVEESKEDYLEETDPPRVVPAAGCCSIPIVLVRLRMKGIGRTGHWRQRKLVVHFVFGVSGVSISERLSFVCSQSRKSCISKGTCNFSCDCSTEHTASFFLLPW